MRRALLPLLLICAAIGSCSCRHTPPVVVPPSPTPTPVVGGPSCGAFAGTSALCLAYNVECPAGLVDRGATFDCQRCCGTPPPATPTPPPVVTPTPRPDHAHLLCYGGWGPRTESQTQQGWAYKQSAPYCSGWIAGQYDGHTQGEASDTVDAHLAAMAPHIQAGMELDEQKEYAPLLDWQSGRTKGANGFAFKPFDSAQTLSCTTHQTERLEFRICRKVGGGASFVVNGIEITDETIVDQIALWKRNGALRRIRFWMAGDELGLDRVTTEALIDFILLQFDAAGVPRPPIAMTFTGDQIRNLDGHLAKNLNIVILEGYGAGFGSRDWRANEAALYADLNDLLARIPLDKDVKKWRSDYDRNGEWLGGPEALAQLGWSQTKWTCAHRDRVSDDLSFVDVRGFCSNGFCQGGWWDYPQLAAQIRRSRLYLESGCKIDPGPEAPEPPEQPKPKPDAPGTVGNTAAAVACKEAAGQCTGYWARVYAGSQAPVCLIDYQVTQDKGEGFTLGAGTLTFATPDAVVPVTVAYAPTTAVSGYRQASVRVSNARGCTLGDSRFRVVVWSRWPVVEWMTTQTNANPRDRITATVVHGGSTDAAVRVHVKTVDGTATAAAHDYDPLDAWFEMPIGSDNVRVQVQINASAVGKALALRIVEATGWGTWTVVGADQPIVVSQ